MIRKLLALFLTLCGSFAVVAAGPALLNKVPEATAGALFIDAKTLMQSAGFAKMARASFWAVDDVADSGVEELLIFTTSKPKLINAAYVQLAKPLDLAKNLTAHKLLFTEGAIAGKHAYFVKHAMLCDELTVVEVEPKLYLLAGKRHHAEAILAMKPGVPPLVTAQSSQLAMPDAPIWYVDTGVKLPVRSQDANQKKARGSIRLCFDPFLAGKTGRFHLLIACPDPSSASQMAVLVPMLSGVVCGVLFSDDPSLNEQVLARIVPQMQGSNFCIDAEIPAELMRKIQAYFKDRDLVQMVQSAIELTNL